jgi:cytidylate kinase
MQFDYMRKKAESGESFVVVGRCSETVLKECPALVSIFILGDKKEKLNRIVIKHNLSLEEAEKLRREKDEKRKKYHNHYCEGKWGDSRNYDISINSSKLGIDETTRILIDYIESRERV